MTLPRINRWVRFAVSATVLLVLLSTIPIRDLFTALARTPASVLLSALTVVVIGHVAAALKWRRLHGGHAGLSVSMAVRAHFLGVVSNLWLPGVVGGDVVRAGALLGRVERPAIVIVASLVDRIIDLVALLLLATLGLLLMGSRGRDDWRVVEAAAVAAVAVGVGLFFSYRFLKARQNPRFARLVEAVDLMVGRPGLVVSALAISLCIQAAFVGVNANLGRAVGMAAPFGAWLMAWPLAKLAALLPISAAGLGVREAALVVLMRPFGDPAGAVVAAGFLWQAMFIVGGLLGCGLSQLTRGVSDQPRSIDASPVVPAWGDSGMPPATR